MRLSRIVRSNLEQGPEAIDAEAAGVAVGEKEDVRLTHKDAELDFWEQCDGDMDGFVHITAFT